MKASVYIDNRQLFGRGAHQGSDPGGSPASDTRVVGDASPVRSVRLGRSGGGSAARRPCGGRPTHQRACGHSDLGSRPASGCARSLASPKWRLAVKRSCGRSACRDSGRQRRRLSCDLESSAPCERRDSREDRRSVPTRRAGVADHLYARRIDGARVMTARRDPIVEEVRKHRAAIAREHGNRLDAILAAFRREEAGWPAGAVSRPAKKLPKPAATPTSQGTRRPNKRLHRTAARQVR